eukprot:jgi/Picsp_1/842/NSC_04330-R1_hypothetical protein COCSUDRAFT_64098 [Coccomyxa subellipsoidea C-169]
MAMFLAVLGGAAVVEIHRALSGPGRDVHQLRKREEELRVHLQEVQQELEKAKKSRDLSEDEKAQLELLNMQLKEDGERLGREKKELENAHEDLQVRVARVEERERLLEQCAESLKLENSMLIQQFERLKVKHEQETSAFEEQMKNLQQQVGTALKSFVNGKFNVKQLQEELKALGVEFSCPEGKTLQLAELEKAGTEKERKHALNKLELKVENGWLENIRLTSSPARATKLFLSGSKLEPAAPSRDVNIPASLEANQKSKNIASHAVVEGTSGDDMIAAVHVGNTAAGPEQEAKAVGKKGFSLRMKKATKKPALENKKEKFKSQDQFSTTNEHLSEDRALIADVRY